MHSQVTLHFSPWAGCQNGHLIAHRPVSLRPGLLTKPAHPIPFLHLLPWHAPPTCHPSPPSSPELSIFPNGPARPLKHSLCPNRRPWQTRNLKVILLCDQTAACTSYAPQREAPARLLWGVGGGGRFREQEGGRQGNASIWKEPPKAPTQGHAGLLRAGGLTPSRDTPSSP